MQSMSKPTKSTGWCRAAVCVLAGVMLLLTGCSGSDQAELERLRKENEQLRAQQGMTPGEVSAESISFFANDPQRGTLAGLVPGDTLATARKRFGPESTSRSWRSDGKVLVQYEWELEPGLYLRLNSNSSGRLTKIAVALDGTRPTNIPIFGGLSVGQDTFSTIQAKYGPLLTTNLQLWGARGLYTVTQQGPVAGANGLAEFSFQLPEGMSPGLLDDIGNEIQRTRKGDALEPHLRGYPPFQIALLESR